MANVTCRPDCCFNTGNEAVVRKLAIQRLTVANAIALPLCRLGKISDSNTQVTGPRVAAQIAIKPNTKINV